MVCGYGVYKPWGCENDKALLCRIERENSPINFGLIAYKHGVQAAQCLFPENPWLNTIPFLPSVVGYMDGSSIDSANLGLQRPLSAARVMGVHC